MLERQPTIGEQAFPVSLCVEGRKDLADVACIRDQPVQRAAGARHKGERRDIVSQGEDVLLGSCLILTHVGGDDPRCVAMLLASALHEADHRLHLSLRVDLRRAQSIANVAFVHQVGEVALWRDAETISSEMGMFRRADKRATRVRSDADAGVGALASGCREHTGRPKVSAPVPGEHLIIRRYILNRPLRSVGHGDKCTCYQTLVVVRHGAEILVPWCLRRTASQEADQLILRLVGVLKLVHMDVLVVPLIVLQHIGIAPPQLIGQQDQVVEVGGVVLAQQVFVAGVDAGGHFFEIFAHLFAELQRREELVLGAGDDAVDSAGVVLLGVQTHLSEHLAHRSELIIVIIDAEMAIEPQSGAFSFAA